MDEEGLAMRIGVALLLDESPFVSSRSIARVIRQDFSKINSSTTDGLYKKSWKKTWTEALRTPKCRSKHVHVSCRFNNGLESAQRIRIIGRIVKELLERGWH